MKDVYQITDLSSRETLDQGADKPALLAVIGNPVRHSASPAMHQAALDSLGLDARYIRLEVEIGQVPEAISRMKDLGFIGCNVTVPHKFEVMGCCDVLSDDAQALGAVNTLIFGDHTVGHNTDAPGFIKAIREDFKTDLADLNVMIVGVGGGAGRAIATQCVRIGCKNVWLVNRTLSKAQELSEQLRLLSTQLGTKTQIHTSSTEDTHLVAAAAAADLMINATSLGLKDADPMPIAPECINSKHMVYDMIYNPAETAMMHHAKSMGAQTANGSSMLLHQGVLAFQSWFPDTEPLEEMRKGLLSVCSR